MHRKTRKSDNRRKGRMVCSVRARWGILAAGILLTAAGGILLMQNKKTEQQEERTLYSCQVTADASYRVHLLPNELFAEEWLPEGRAYSEKLTDTIEVSLKAGLVGSKEVLIHGNYQIGAVIEGYQSGADARKIIYEKQFPLKEGMLPQTASHQASMEETVSLDLREFRSYVDQAELALGGSTSRELTLRFEGMFVVEAGEKTEEKHFSYRMPIALGMGNSFFSIDKPKATVEEGKITEMLSVETGPSAEKLFLAFGMMFAGIAAIVFVSIGTRLPEEDEDWCMKMSNMIRKYGSRMVRLQTLPGLAGRETVCLESIESMILMAEEIRQPVFYSLDENGLPEEGIFYVPDRDRIYLLQYPRPSTTFVVDEAAGSGSQNGS